tara:strand:- start:2980 stop:3714 length:735 start_codon:yes stop_codon:yes gene_type:complete
MADNQRTLSDACAPLFLMLSAFRRNAATATTTIKDLKVTLQREFDRVRTECERDPRLHPQFERAFYALVATADQVVLSSAWSQRAGWSMNLLETHYFGRAEGGKEFYRLVDAILDEGGDSAADIAKELFRCMAMGFQGELMGERTELDRRRRQLFEKARLAGSVGETLTPDAYGRNASRDMTKLPTVGILRMVAVTIAALIVFKLGAVVVTSASTSEVRERVEGVVTGLSAEGASTDSTDPDGE